MALIGRSSALGIRIEADSATNRFRSARFATFMQLVDKVLAEKGTCSILDVGGTPGYWNAFGPVMPSGVSVTVTNLFDDVPEDTEAMHFARVDACDMPYDDNAFDIVHSNSVIEHVGLWNRQHAMAREIGRVAPRHFVQTPNYWFPVEPHCRTLFYHWLPEPVRVGMLMKRDLGFWQKGTDIGHATEQMQSAILLTYRQMEFLFPGSEIRREKFAGLTKSLIAIRG